MPACVVEVLEGRCRNPYGAPCPCRFPNRKPRYRSSGRAGHHGRMFRNRDPEARLDDLIALMDATTASELHRALVLGPPAAYEREVSKPLSYFRSVHDHDPALAAETAMLLATDPRWRVAAGPLLEAIDATGIVAPEELDLLARAFVSAEATVYWTCPDDWFSTVGIVIAESDDPADSLDGQPDESDEPSTTVAARVVPPGIRRWAAARAIRVEPSTWADVYARASELGGEAGGALLRGMLDAVDALPSEARPLVRKAALKSGRSDVRKAALQQVAESDWSRARTLGMRDANEQVRRWASDLADPATAATPGVGAALDNATTMSSSSSSSKRPAMTQASLFE